MASRSTRSQGKNSTQSPSTPLLKNRARKSMGTSPQSAIVSKKSKRTRSSSDSSIDSSIVNVQSTSAAPSQVQDSSDSEDASNSFMGTRNKVSDTGYTSQVKVAGRGRRDLPSTSRTPVVTASRGITNTTLNTSRGSNASMSTSSQGRMGGTQETKWVNKCVFYILVADQKKHAIKKADIVKNVFENQSSKEHYTAVLDKANEVLKKTFGLELLQIKNNKNSYILVNILDSDQEIRQYIEYSPEELQMRGLVMLLLTIIFMNDNSILEDKLWKALEPLGLYSNSTIAHPIFGNVKKYITVDLVKELYLEYTCINKDPVQYEFTWGERAIAEFKKEDLLDFACQMIGDNIQPEDWKLQFIDAKPKPSNVEAENF